MAGWNGSGGFTRPHDYTADLAAGAPSSTVSASKVDEDFDNIVTGLQNVLARDGQNSPSANVSWGGYKITNLGTPSASTDAATKGYADGLAVSTSLSTATIASGDYVGILDVSDSSALKRGLVSDIVTLAAVQSDAAFTLQDNSDATKQLQFQLSGISTGTTRTLTIPNASGTLYISGGTDVAIADGGTGASDAATAFSNLKQAASTSATGVVELATDAEAQAKSSTSVVLTPSNLGAMQYTSAEVTVAAGDSGTITHNLGSSTVKVEMYLVCKTAELGYSVNDEIGPFVQNTMIFGSDRGFAARSSSSNATAYKIGGGGLVLINPSTGASGIITASSWRAKFVVSIR